MNENYVLWLIEHPENAYQTPVYWGVEEDQEGWAGDIKWAFKFETSADAEKHAEGVGIPDYRIIDHKWLDHKPTTKSVVA
jgi:hypothetical protein